MKNKFLPSGIYSGLIAGAVFMILEMLMVKIFLNGSPWGPPRMIAAIGMGKSVLPPPPTFDFKIVMIAMVIHFFLAIVFALIIGFIVSKMKLGNALVVGVIAGLLLYFINFYGLTVIFPWFAKARSWVTIFSHIAFGLVAAWTFVSFYRPDSYSPSNVIN
ncbi:MAG: hypothetical protein M3139_15025 [Bacteroidota bacterium]|nr:hypothetical protein [Bacteroidota bacterium]